MTVTNVKKSLDSGTITVEFSDGELRNYGFPMNGNANGDLYAFSAMQWLESNTPAEMYTVEELKAIKGKKINTQANALFKRTSDYVEREHDRTSGKLMPDWVFDERTAIRAAIVANEAALDACEDYDALVAFTPSWLDDEPTDLE